MTTALYPHDWSSRAGLRTRGALPRAAVMAVYRYTHGYGLIAEVARLSDGRISLRPGTLYGALDRLVDAGLVAVEREETVDGRLRRYYRLTEPGGAVLVAETERMRRNVEAATARLRVAMPLPRLGGEVA